MHPEQHDYKSIRVDRGFMGRGIGFIYYWFDLFGPEKHPANSKVQIFFALFIALSAEIYFGWLLSRPGGGGITWPYVSLVLGTLSMAMGIDAFKSMMRIKNGNRQSNEDERT